MAFEPLLSGLTWIFVVVIPLALLVVLFDSNASPAPPCANTRAAHLRGDADSRSSSDSQSPSPSPSPERRRPRHRHTVPLAPTLPPQTTASGSLPIPSSRRTHAINTYIDQLMARRHVHAVFDDNSVFDFHPGDGEEYWSDEEQGLSFSSSSQHRHHDGDRYHDSQDRAAPPLTRDFSGKLVTTGERPSAAAPPHDRNYDHDLQRRKPPNSHNNTIMKEVLQQLEQESPAKASARAAVGAMAQRAVAANSKAKQKPPLPWRPTPPHMKQRVPYETPSTGSGSDGIADSQFSPRAQKDSSNETPLLASQDSSKLTPERPSSSIPATSPQDEIPKSSPTGQKACINTHIDALMRQQGIQHTNWAHVDMPSERSAGGHQFQDVESHIHPEGEDPGDVDASKGSGAEAGEPYSYQRSRGAARITSMILPYTHRYDAERDLLASSIPSASASAFKSAPCRTDSQPQPPKQVRFSRSAPLVSTPQLLCAEDPVFEIGSIDAVSPSVARQIEMRAGGVLFRQDEDEWNGEPDWSDDKYRYGDIAGDDHDDDWAEMPSDR